MSISDKQIENIQRELMEQIDSEVELDKYIESQSDNIASQLFLNPDHNMTVSIDNAIYELGYRILQTQQSSSKYIFMLAANKNKQKFCENAGKQYMPFKINAEMDLNYSEKDNLKAATEALIRHITGNIKPELLED